MTYTVVGLLACDDCGSLMITDSLKAGQARKRSRKQGWVTGERDKCSVCSTKKPVQFVPEASTEGEPDGSAE